MTCEVSTHFMGILPEKSIVLNFYCRCTPKAALVVACHELLMWCSEVKRPHQILDICAYNIGNEVSEASFFFLSFAVRVFNRKLI